MARWEFDPILGRDVRMPDDPAEDNAVKRAGALSAGHAEEALAMRKIKADRESFGNPPPSAASADTVDDLEFEHRAFDDSEDRRWREEQWETKRQDAQRADEERDERYG